MYPKNSRYYKLPEELTIDPQGRPILSKTLRTPPPTSGIFQHTLEDGDRLDHLAKKYYDQPRKWWRICDANPDFISPQALLGKTPIITQQIPIKFPKPEPPPWANLINAIAQQVGIKNVWLADKENAIFVTFNQRNITSKEILAIIKTQGFASEQPQSINRTGKSIVIPPDSLG